MGTPEVRDHPEKIVEGWGWNHMGWPGRAWPTAVRFVVSREATIFAHTLHSLSSTRSRFSGDVRLCCRVRTGMLSGFPRPSWK
jgi:hypothetical protein